MSNSNKKVNQNEQNCSKDIQEYISSSEEDDTEVDEDVILRAMFEHYKNGDKMVTKSMKKSALYFDNHLHTGATTCLICICKVRRTDSIWSCRNCFCFLHLTCVRRWANDSLAQIRETINQNQYGYYNNLGEYIEPRKPRELVWCCPQCRVEYKEEDRPTQYLCFCGKEVNPPLQNWLVPHSCGEICGKLLKPECGHTCMLLCHPGPCPPCAQYATTSCLCGKSEPTSVRCCEKVWQCERKCTHRLPCKVHICNEICHKPGQCPPCSSASMQTCECGREMKERKCSELRWQCKAVCGRKYSCGLHTCKRVCHKDRCGDCPLGQPRTCPCGKTKKVGPCSDVIESCGDTCQKVLPCGIHTCTQRCHRGPCNLCMVIIEKRCRCGRHARELPCSREFLCETKCRQIRECGKHACNRKCCDGNCPPCDKICGKPLSCKKHKCKSVCHDGPCFPCQRQSKINCRCGKTSKSVQCGSERTTRFACAEPCRIASRCHHASRHHCHKNECPPCNKMCGLVNDTSGCGHICEAKCHAAVRLPKNSNTRATMIWALDSGQRIEYAALPHPKCEKLVEVPCIGGHEIAQLPCWNSKPRSCQRKCNRLLRCGNHKCELVCHAVADVKSMNQQTGCEDCDKGCLIQRPPGCTHPCSLACHLPPCPPCNYIIRAKCHCGLSKLLYKCSEYYSTDGTEEDIQERQESLKSCGNRCLNNYPCGHRCRFLCHSGECPCPELCRKKVRIYCACKSCKSDVTCDKYRAGLVSLECVETCVATQAKREKEAKAEEEKLRQEEEIKNRLEMEQFEKKFNKRKPKERKVVVEKPKKQINWKLIAIYFGIIIAVMLAIVAAVIGDN